MFSFVLLIDLANQLMNALSQQQLSGSGASVSSIRAVIPSDSDDRVTLSSAASNTHLWLRLLQLEMEPEGNIMQYIIPDQEI